MTGCAGAGSHPQRSTLALTFTGLGVSLTLIALLSSYLFFARLPGTHLDQAGARFGLA